MVYVFYRTPNPANATVAEVEMILQQNNIEVSQLVEWSTDHCEDVESFAQLFLLLPELSSGLNVEEGLNIFGK
jgi:hypothetical protein